MLLKNSFLCAMASLALSACVMAPTVGSAPSETPPKIIVDPADSKSRIWDNPATFGPVPASEKARGAAVCSSLDRDNLKHVAIGYHPKAQNIDGKPFDGGGFFCVRN
jgi:hypothetical protein